MNLMTMQFGSFVFPMNPTELKLERACLLRETVGVDGEERVEAVGKRKARVAGKGHFTGENAMALYRELERFSVKQIRCTCRGTGRLRRF